MAIAAIVLGIIGGVLQGGAGTLLVRVGTLRLAGLDAVRILSLSPTDVHDSAGRWYDSIASADFRGAVTREGFEAWVNRTMSSFGKLQDQRVLPKLRRTRTGRIEMRLQGQFANGTKPIEVVLAVQGQQRPRIDDIRVGDSSPRQ